MKTSRRILKKRRKTRRRRNRKQRGGAITPIVYCFWTGTNEMSEQRKERLNDLVTNAGCKVQLVDPSNLDTYIHPDRPLHEAYQYLSETHKSDYLRTYFMHFHGGGYSDIKSPGGDWTKAFEDMNANENIVLNGYHEVSPEAVAGDDTVKSHWQEIPGNGAYIVRPNTDFTKEWYTRLLAVLDQKLDTLKQFPATNPQATPDTSPGYPIEWTEILGNIFHPLIHDYRDRCLFTVPIPVFSGYR